MKRRFSSTLRFAYFVLLAALVLAAHLPAAAQDQAGEPDDPGEPEAPDSQAPAVRAEDAAGEEETLSFGATAVTPPERTGEPIQKRIDKQELRARGSSTVIQAIEQEPAVFAQTNARGERIFRLRGFDQRGVAVYLDGVPYIRPWRGGVDLNKLPAEMIDSIVVIKGPTSLRNGPNGMGGNVLIETRDPGTGPLLEAQLEGGGLEEGPEEGRASLYHGMDTGAVAYALGVAGSIRGDYSLSSQYEPRHNTEGEPLANAHGKLDNSDRRQVHAAGKLGAPLGNHSLGLQGFALDGEYGIPRATTDDRPIFRRFTWWRVDSLQATHRLQLDDFALRSAAFAAFYDNRMDYYDDDTYSTQLDSNAASSEYRDRSYGGRVQGEWVRRGLAAGPTHVRFSLDVRHDVHNGQDLLGGIDNDVHIFRRTLFTVVQETELPLAERWSSLFALQTEVDIPEVSAEELELMYADPSDIKTTGNLGPTASLKYDAGSGLMARVTAALRHRIPTLTERFGKEIGYQRASPTLKPEEALYFGLETRWPIGDRLTLELSGFDAEIRDLIDRQYISGSNGVRQNRNIDRARFAGAEAALVYRPLRELRLEAAYAYLHARRLNQREDEEDRIAQIPAHQATLGAAYQPLRQLEVSSYLQIVGAQAFDDYTILGLGELGPYAVWNARVSYQPASFIELYLKGTNLLDMNYQTKYGFPDRGLLIWLGCTYRYQGADTTI
jgi:iron complex outermembrane receptor protein